MMCCEWLTSEDWSDVHLLCNGRTFSAHRAVLASVSSFLREVLLSCPVKDSTAYIILPDFDLTAMSCVLHYIYHGEVVIPQCSLYLFLEIVEAMHIYVDPQFLSKAEIKKASLGYKENVENSSYIKSDANTRGDIHQNESNLRKNAQSKTIMRKLEQSFHGLDFGGEKIQGGKASENIASSPGDKKRCEDRQKISDIRDLFIETYAQNGNSNGVSAGVLAISNERYHGRTSVLFTNANGKHPSDGTLLKPSKITSKFRSYLTPLRSPSTSLRTYDGFFVSSNNINSENISEFVGNNEIEFNFSLNAKGMMNYWIQDVNKPMNLKKTIVSADDYSALDLRTSQTKSKYIMLKIAQDDRTNVNINQEVSNNKCMRSNATTTFNKDKILNQVLRNPWHSQIPNDYKPFRRKTTLVDFVKIQSKLDSDRNNNVNLLMLPINKSKCVDNSSKSDLEDATETSHVLQPNDGNLLKCTSCNQVFSNNDSLKLHMRRHSAVTRYSCGECCKTFSQLRNYKYHMSVHRGTKEFATTCPICGKYFNDRGYLSSHMKIHRNRKEYKCAMCPKSFNQRVAYNMHLRIHTGVKPHVCDECGKAFSRKMLLKQHQRTHSGERPYACSYCDKRFADRSNMTLHLRLHTGVKPFSCSICSKSFTKKHHLKSHLNFHTGAKPYSCPRCKLAFTQSSNMRTHFKKCSVTEGYPTIAEKPQ